MKIASFRAFAQAREEIWFWPSAALAYYVTITDSALVLGGFVISLFAGAVTYKLHEALREFFEEEKSISQVRRRVSRKGTGDSSKLSFDFFQGLFDLIAPSRPASQITVVIGMLVNMILFFTLYLWLIQRVVRSASPTITEMSLFSLPPLMMAIAISSLVWNS